MSYPATTSQTVGPYFKIGLEPLNRTEISDESPAQRITIQGRVLDADGEPVPDAVIETWQANAAGRYIHPEDLAVQPDGAGFFGFGRIPTDENGFFRFTTIKPGPVPAPDGSMQAPHIVVSIFMRGLLTRLITRIYFFGDRRNENDFALNLVEPARRSTLIAQPSAADNTLHTWDVNLQGENETVFFDC
jgi:protocatechuate 3,4-dioxygenase, alpha subunit